MINRISYINIPKVGINAVIDGRAYSITSDNPSYHEVEAAITNEEDPGYIADLFNAANAIKRFTRGAVEVSSDGGALLYQGEEVNNVVTQRILAFMKAGLPVEPLIAFLERLMANPSRRSIEELYKFLEKEHLPITEDGCFLGYKAITNDWKDKYTGTEDNSVGVKLYMKRQDVDDDARHDCSNGYHVGSLEYASNFGSDDDRLVIVKVDPADVVSVPYSDANKLRTQSYEVVCEYHGALDSRFADGRKPYLDAGYECSEENAYFQDFQD